MSTCDLAQAAHLMKAHEETVAKMIGDGVIPAAKIGRAWVMLERDILEHIELEVRTQTAARLKNKSPKL